MKQIIIGVFSCVVAFSSAAQTTVIKQIDQTNPPLLALAPFRYLASDELMGRGSTRPEIHVAARYISEQFRSFGLKEVQGTADYFQQFEIKLKVPGDKGTFILNSKTFELNDRLLQVNGEDVVVTAPVIFAGYGTVADLEKIDVKGKIVVTNLGLNDSSSAMQGFMAIQTKEKLLKDKGAVAMVERFKPADIPWEGLHHYLTTERVWQPSPATLPVFILNDTDTSIVPLLHNEVAGKLDISGNRIKTIPARNVVAVSEGSDPVLKNQYIVLSAHYDHVGVAPKPKMEEGKMDSIYNGARDNAIGTAAIINAARYFSRYPSKRSILFIAYTAEEMGLVGSRHFAENPLVPLKQLVYNLNIDNASYNDTTIVTVIGLGRTSADNDIQKACRAYGLTATADPAPEQNLFDRSDNVSLAAKGIPAPTFSLGIRKFDETITNRYHQLSDEVNNFNLNYAMKYIKSFILAAKQIADNPQQPVWKKNDKYEAAWKTLYAKPF